MRTLVFLTLFLSYFGLWLASPTEAPGTPQDDDVAEPFGGGHIDPDG